MRIAPAAVILAAIFLGDLASAQTGFPVLPPVPQTGQLENQPAATKFCFIAAGDNRPATTLPRSLQS